MTSIQALVLGLIQGLTEFLPLSSSGHLVIAQKLFAISQAPILFDVFVHVATLFAVIIFLRQELFTLTKKQIIAIIAATIPTGIIGLFLNHYKSFLFNSLFLVAFGLSITSLLLLLSKLFKPTKSQHSITIKKALIIGLSQGFAVIPGISRAGATLVTGLALGISPKKIFPFSFIISIPAILAALALQISDSAINNQTSLTALVLGFIAALFTGLLALKLLQKSLYQKKLFLFSFYTIPLVIITIALAMLTVE